jgi:hypothetical protein
MGAFGWLKGIFGGKTKGDLLAVLRTYRGEPDEDSTIRRLVHQPIGADLGAFLAYVGMDESGDVHTEYFTHAHLRKHGGEEALPELYKEAYASLAMGFSIRGKASPAGQVLQVRHPMGLGSSMLCLPNAHQQLSRWVKHQEVFVGFTAADNLMVTTMGHRQAIDPLVEQIRNTRAPEDSPVIPAAYRLNLAGLTRLAKAEG